MASVDSNLAHIAALLDQLADPVDMTRDGLGADLLDIIADGIVERNAAQTAPDGSQWAENRGGYAIKKGDAGLPVGVGFKRRGREGSTGGMMLSRREIQGQRSITPHEAVMGYGTTPDQRDKAEWFTGGSEGADGCQPSGAKGQPPRPFYGLDDNINKQLHAHIEAYLTEIVHKLSSS